MDGCPSPRISSLKRVRVELDHHDGYSVSSIAMMADMLHDDMMEV
jgi:hypothetical protein